MTVSALKNAAGSIGVVALDEAYTLADSLGLSLKEPSHEQILTEVFSTLLQIHGQQATGLVLDSVYTLPLLKEPDNQAKILTRLEQVQEPDPLTVPKLLKNWSVKDTHNMYAMAKLELFYHPAEEQALVKKQFLAELFDFCQHEEVDFLVKLMIYNPLEKKLDTAQFQEAQLEAVSELQGFADIFALQYPQDPLATATLTSSLDTPWLVVADETPYDQFKDDLRVSIENGAGGFLAGEALWQEVGGLRQQDQSPDLAAIQKFLQTTTKDRIIELMRIISEESLALDESKQ